MELSNRHIYLCKVTQIKPTFILLQANNINGICHISEVSDYLVKNLNDYFEINKSYYFLLLNPNDVNHKYKFSYKQIHPKQLRWHYGAIPTINGFKNIYENTTKLIKD